MEIYLDHPYNGARVVYSMGEANELFKTGWVLRDPQPGQKKAVEPVVEPVVEDDKPRRKHKA
jgi:hypothetical protein